MGTKPRDAKPPAHSWANTVKVSSASMAPPPSSSKPSPVHSWADKVRVSSSKNRFALKSVVHVLEGDIPRISVPHELTDSVSSSRWDRCLVGYFPGPSMPFHAVRAIAARVWGPYGLECSLASEGFFVFRFVDEDSLHNVLQAGPWMFGGKAFILQQWSPSFVFNKEMINTVPVWVKLHGLPFPLWTEDGLSFVASIIGKPIACDKATHEGTRLAYARICVELDASKSPVHFFDLDTCLSANPIRVKVDYEWKPRRCVDCCVFGHDCRDKKDEVARQKMEPKSDPKQPGEKGKEVQEMDGHAGKHKGHNGPDDQPRITVNHERVPSLGDESRDPENSNVACPAAPLSMVRNDVTTSKNAELPKSTERNDNIPSIPPEPLALLPPSEQCQTSSSLASEPPFGKNSLKKGFLNSDKPLFKSISDHIEKHNDNLPLVFSKFSEFGNYLAPDLPDEDTLLNLANSNSFLSQAICGLNTEASLGSSNKFQPLSLDPDSDFSDYSSDSIDSYIFSNLERKTKKIKNKGNKLGRKPRA